MSRRVLEAIVLGHTVMHVSDILKCVIRCLVIVFIKQACNTKSHIQEVIFTSFVCRITDYKKLALSRLRVV